MCPYIFGKWISNRHNQYSRRASSLRPIFPLTPEERPSQKGQWLRSCYRPSHYPKRIKNSSCELTRKRDTNFTLEGFISAESSLRVSLSWPQTRSQEACPNAVFCPCFIHVICNLLSFRCKTVQLVVVECSNCLWIETWANDLAALKATSSYSSWWKF